MKLILFVLAIYMYDGTYRATQNIAFGGDLVLAVWVMSAVDIKNVGDRTENA